MMNKLISHSFEKNEQLTLWEHINQVIKVSRYIISQKALNFNGITKEQIEELCTLTAVCHDFGKSTSFFQEYIKPGMYEGNEREKSHSLISAFFGWYMTEKWISKNNRLDNHWRDFIPFAVFTAIECHHGKYKSINESINGISTAIDSGLLERQINAIDAEIFNYGFFGFKLSDCEDFDMMVICDVHKKFRRFWRNYKNIDFKKQIEPRILALLLYSVLLEEVYF